MVTDGWFFRGFSGFHFLVLFRCFSFKRVKFPNSSGGDSEPFYEKKTQKRRFLHYQGRFPGQRFFKRDGDPIGDSSSKSMDFSLGLEDFFTT